MNRATVSELQELVPPPTRAEGAPELPDLPPPNEELIKTRAERAVAKAQAEALNVNERVTVREQMIFSELSKTMQSDWVEKKGDSPQQCILVLGAVSPCAAASCGPTTPPLLRSLAPLAPRPSPHEPRSDRLARRCSSSRPSRPKSARASRLRSS